MCFPRLATPFAFCFQSGAIIFTDGRNSCFQCHEEFNVNSAENTTEKLLSLFITNKTTGSQIPGTKNHLGLVSPIRSIALELGIPVRVASGKHTCDVQKSSSKGLLKGVSLWKTLNFCISVQMQLFVAVVTQDSQYPVSFSLAKTMRLFATAVPQFRCDTPQRLGDHSFLCHSLLYKGYSKYQITGVVTKKRKKKNFLSVVARKT